MHYHYFTLEQREALAQAMADLPEPQRQSLHAPDYGICEECEGDIPFVRLMRNPLLRRCPSCQR